MGLSNTLARVLMRHDELRNLLAQPGLGRDQFGKFSKEYADLTPVAEAIADLQKIEKEQEDAESLLTDPDYGAEAKKELEAIKPRLPILKKQIQRLLIPKDEADARNAILEIRAGTGGDEAALFGALLFEMYRKYASHRGWRFEVLDLSENDLGGVREGTAMITGRDVFARMKFESGVHRVQRVPKTEASGRVHTSTATVAVLPEMEDVDIDIDERDLKIDVYRSSGAGGQKVNKTESAVRMTHLPTGLVVAMQDERSQHKNRAKALKILRSKIYDQQRTNRDAAHAAERKSQVGTGDRSERIRTYNFPQGRVSDHRIEKTLYNMEGVINGEALDEFVDELISRDEAERLALVQFE